MYDYLLWRLLCFWKHLLFKSEIKLKPNGDFKCHSSVAANIYFKCQTRVKANIFPRAYK